MAVVAVGLAIVVSGVSDWSVALAKIILGAAIVLYGFLFIDVDTTTTRNRK